MIEAYIKRLGNFDLSEFYFIGRINNINSIHLEMKLINKLFSFLRQFKWRGIFKNLINNAMCFSVFFRIHKSNRTGDSFNFLKFGEFKSNFFKQFDFPIKKIKTLKICFYHHINFTKNYQKYQMNLRGNSIA